MSVMQSADDLIVHEDRAADWAAVYSDMNGELLHQGHLSDVYEWVVTVTGVRTRPIPLDGRSAYPVSIR